MTQRTRSAYSSWMFINLTIIALVGLALWLTGSLWSFVGLTFMATVSNPTYDTKCPKCSHIFRASRAVERQEE